MENVILILVLAAILGGAVAYIVKVKKSGVKCIGCSAGRSCGTAKGASCSGCSSCSSGSTGCGCGGNEDDIQESCECREETK